MQAYLAQLEAETEDDSEVAALEKELEKLETEEKQYEVKLASLQEEKAKADRELEEQKARRKELEKEEQRYWTEYSLHNADLLKAEDEYRSLECKLRYTQVKAFFRKKISFPF